MLCCAAGALLFSLLLTWRRGMAVLASVAGGWLASGAVVAVPLLLVAAGVIHVIPESVVGPAAGTALCLFE